MTIRKFRYTAVVTATLLFGLVGTAFGHDGEKHNEQSPKLSPLSNSASAKVTLEDLDLVNRAGERIRFATEAVGDRVVVIDFVYTNCKTLCPVLSQTMAQVQDMLDEQQRKSVRLISVSVDPGTDTPERLRRAASIHGAGPDWLWLTGFKPDVNRVLSGLGVYTPDFTEHPSVILVGDGQSNQWTRFYGFPSAEQIRAKVESLLASREETRRVAAKTKTPDSDAERIDKKNRAYFTDLPVVTHLGKEKKFYTDLLRGKIVLMSVFFTDCSDACPLVNQKLANLQEMLDEKMGSEVFFVSVTLDPERDTLETLKKYAASFEAGKGWDFVTGDPATIRTITYKLGQVTKNIEAHTSFLVIGDVKHGRWKKFPPYAREEVLAEFLSNLAAGS